MTPYFETGDIQIYHGDAREVLSELDVEATACVTDPPYGLGEEPDPADVMRAWANGMDPDVGGGGFMGEDWDSFVPAPNTFEAIYGSLLPGAPMLCFAGSRTADWMGMSIRFGGFERRDTLQYLFGSGFPKSHDLSGDIAEKENVDVVEKPHPTNNCKGGKWCDCDDRNERSQSGSTAHPPKYEYPESSDAAKWQSHGTALGPAHEPVILAMKPKDGTFAENALEHGTAGLNIDGARLEYDGEVKHTEREADGDEHHQGGTWEERGRSKNRPSTPTEKGRWPANVVLDEAAAELVDRQSPERTMKPTGSGAGGHSRSEGNCYDTGFTEYVGSEIGASDNGGGASRFFYTAKASKSDRNAGLPPGEENDHPTVKPTDLMGWLLRLVEMPERNLILDPFCGSGTTLYVAQQMGLPAIGIDQDEESCELAAKRLSEPSLFSQE